MITFKELNKYNEVLDVKRESIGILNAIVLYEKYHTDKNVLHLFSRNPSFSLVQEL